MVNIPKGKLRSTASQIRELCDHGFSAREIASRLQTTVGYVWEVRAGHRDKDTFLRNTIRNADIVDRLIHLEDLMREIRAQVGRLNGEPDDPCDRRLLGLAL